MTPLYRHLVAALLLLPTGCTQSHCTEEGLAPSDASGVDADAPEEVGCASGVGHVYLGPLLRPEDATAYACSPAAPPLDVSIFDATGHFVERRQAVCIMGTSYSDLGAMAPGRYSLAVRSDDLLAGGWLLDAPECATSELRRCVPIEVEVRPCGVSAVPIIRGCPPGVSDCGGGS